MTSLFGEPVQGGAVTFAAPSSGASASPRVVTAAIGASGQASVSVIANTVAGSYTVTASAAGVVAPARFGLTNKAAAAMAVADLVSGAGASGRDVQSSVALLVGNPVTAADCADPISAATVLHDAALAQWYSSLDEVRHRPGSEVRPT
jgi:hypothetical protein